MEFEIRENDHVFLKKESSQLRSLFSIIKTGNNRCEIQIKNK